MFTSEILNDIRSNFLRHKGRTIFTSFSVFWGVFILVMMVSSGIGVGNGLYASMDVFPDNCFYCIPRPTSVASNGFPAGRIWNFTEKDVERLKERYGNDIIGVSVLNCLPNMTVPVSNERYSGLYMLTGATPIALQCTLHEVIEGRYLTQMDIDGMKHVCVIGENVAKELFSGQSPINRQLNVDGTVYTVVGVSRPSFDMAALPLDFYRTIIIPLPLMRNIYNQGDEAHLMSIIFRPDLDSKEMQADVCSSLRTWNNVAADDDSALTFYDIKERRSQVSVLYNGFQLLLWIVAIGILFSGFLGIANIEMIAVKERTREIALRMALGASSYMIGWSIVLESLVLSGISAMFGLSAGAIALKVMRDSISAQNGVFADPYIPLWSLFVSISIILLGGVLAGIVPAVKAMKQKPIDSLKEK